MTENVLQNGNGQVKDRTDSVISGVIVFHICLMQCKNMLVSSGDFFFRYNETLNNIVIVLMAMVYLYTFISLNIISRIRMKTVIIIALIVAYFFVSHLVDPKLFVSDQFPYDYVKRNFKLYIAYCLPVFVYVSCLRTTDVLVEKFYKSATIVFLVATITFLTGVRESSWQKSYSMSFGNNLLLLCIILIFKYIDYKRRTDLIMFLILLIYILSCGSRGPFVSLAFLIMYYLVSMNGGKKKTALLTVTSIFLVIIFMFYDTIAKEINDLLVHFGITSRTLNMFLGGNITYDSGRSEYHRILIQSINESPFFGLGAFGGEKTVGLAHSLIYDIFANFGYGLGSAFMLFFVMYFYKTVKNNRGSSLNKLIFMCSLYVFPRMTFAMEFWKEWQLWFIYGLLVAFGGRKARNNLKNDELIKES